jgi:hypothetical protein
VTAYAVEQFCGRWTVKDLMSSLNPRSKPARQTDRRKRHTQPFRIYSADSLLAVASPIPTTYTRRQFKAALHELGLRQCDFAALVGLDPPIVYRWREDCSPFPAWVGLLITAWLATKRQREPLLPLGLTPNGKEALCES